MSFWSLKVYIFKKMTERIKHIEIVEELFRWNAKNLVQSAHLKKSDLQQYFADFFLVIANGKTYEANHDNYLEFLNQFRLTIQSIRYDFGDFIADQVSVALPLKAQIVRTNGSVENFEAILILKFNDRNRIILWHEVYLKV